MTLACLDLCFRRGEPCPTSASMTTLAACRPQVEHLVARILRRKKDDPDVQDCTNETLQRALEAEKRPDEALLPWLLGVARHVALDALRAEYRRRAQTGRSSPERMQSSPYDDLISSLPDKTLDPEMLASTRQSVRHLESALLALPEQQRAALLALHVEGLGYRDVASRMGVPVATIGTWVLRARQSLLDALPSVRTRTPLPRQERNGNK